MSRTPLSPRPPRPRRLRVGVVDLLTKKPTRTLNARVTRPNYAAIMPQAIAVWAAQLGHEVHYVTYTGLEDLARELPRQADLVFVCGFTSAAYLAYAVSHLYRKQGTVTVLGGPHARAFAEDARAHFDYVCGFTDRELVGDLLGDFAPHPGEGVYLSADRHPQALPSLRERWPYVEHNLAKSRLLHVVPMLSSLGCPFQCAFCLDSQVPYQPLPEEQLREDLIFLQAQRRHPVVGWQDPNFGVRFDAHMEMIEEVVRPGAVRFIGECNLSVLTEPHLERLRRNGFMGAIIGIESWFDYSGKAGQKGLTGEEKVRAVGEQVDVMSHYIPYIQANFIMGLDCDRGPEPFELTKRFLDRAPPVMPTYRLLTSFGDSAPLDRQLQEDGRVLDMPYHLLDTHSIVNVRLKNYDNAEFYGYLTDLTRYTFSPSMVWRRFTHDSHSLLGAARWVQLVRSKGLLGKGRYAYYRRLRERLAGDAEFAGFCAGDSAVLPAVLREKIRADLGEFCQHLPLDVDSYLTTGRRVA